MPNTLIFIDIPSPDPDATAQFYRGVMDWEIRGRPSEIFYQIVPGGEFLLPDGNASGVGNLHLGIFSTDDPRPDWTRDSAAAGSGGFAPRVYIRVPDRAEQSRILTAAERRGATVLWRDRYWREFNGFHGSFRDPWGTQMILWTPANEDDQIPADAEY